MKGTKTVSSEAVSLRRAGRGHEEAEAPFEMANLRPESTGLPMTIWVSERGRARHGPRIKVSLSHGKKIDIRDTVSVTIEDEPRVVGGKLTKADLDAVRQYIRINQGALLSFWSGEFDTVELVRRLNPLAARRRP